MNKGFGLTGILIAIVIILTAGTAGVYVVKNTDLVTKEIDDQVVTEQSKNKTIVEDEIDETSVEESPIIDTLPVETSPIIDTLPVETSPIIDTLPFEGSICEPVKPQELEGISGNELIKRWLNYAECKGIDINEIPEIKLRDCDLGDSKCEEINKERMQATDFTIWFKSSYEIILSEGLDPALAEYVKDLSQDHSTPVIIQFNRSTSIAEMIELIELGFRYYRGSALANKAYLTFVPASSIYQIASKSYIAGITLFKPSFKYDLIPTTTTSAFVYTIEESKPYHESDLNRIGIDVFGYDETNKFYVVKMSSSQYDDVANLEWTMFIHAAPEETPESSAFDPREW